MVSISKEKAHEKGRSTGMRYMVRVRTTPSEIAWDRMVLDCHLSCMSAGACACMEDYLDTRRLKLRVLGSSGVSSAYCQRVNHLIGHTRLTD
jgi:hypothetical protein